MINKMQAHKQQIRKQTATDNNNFQQSERVIFEKTSPLPCFFFGLFTQN